MNPTRVILARRVKALASVVLVLAGCSVNQAESDPVIELGCGGECDAGPEEPEFLEELIEAGVEDAIVEQSDAGTVAACPGVCIPDFASECADQSAPVEVESMSLFSFNPAGVEEADAGAPTGDTAALPVATDGGTQDEGAPRSEADASVDGEGPATPIPADEVGTDLAAATEDDAGGPLVPVDPIDAGETLAPPDAVPSRYSCQMTHGQNGVRAECALAGSGVMSDACSSGRDCAPGFGCVEGRSGSGQCQPYCCEGRTSCDAGQICTERRLVAEGMPEEMEVMVPVCAIPDQCDLSDPYPCPTGQHCSCRMGFACSVVGRDGAKACVEPGTGMEGDECPCAAGYFCSPQRLQCMKHCQLGSDACGEGKCQGVGGFPEGIGLCVEVELADEGL